MAGSRAALRSRWIERRLAFVTSPDGALAQASLRVHLQGVLATLEPDCLGVYWAIRGEFNAAGGFGVDTAPTGLPLALPFAQREGRVMHYRSWDGSLPTIDDECGIPTSAGSAVLPDVVLVPCLGYMRSGHRLGYGAGYFDRWLAAHPQVTTVGVAWSVGELDATSGYVAQAHDRPLALIVTEHGLVD